VLWFFYFVLFALVVPGGNEISQDDRNEEKKRWEYVLVFGERKWGEREKRGGWG
jgi:hypothetical protein